MGEDESSAKVIKEVGARELSSRVLASLRLPLEAHARRSATSRTIVSAALKFRPRRPSRARGLTLLRRPPRRQRGRDSTPARTYAPFAATPISPSLSFSHLPSSTRDTDTSDNIAERASGRRKTLGRGESGWDPEEANYNVPPLEIRTMVILAG